MKPVPPKNGEKEVAGRMGTFAGVFTPSILTILGIILFLRLGYVVGSAGLWRALVIIGLTFIVRSDFYAVEIVVIHLDAEPCKAIIRVFKSAVQAFDQADIEAAIAGHSGGLVPVFKLQRAAIGFLDRDVIILYVGPIGVPVEALLSRVAVDIAIAFIDPVLIRAEIIEEDRRRPPIEYQVIEVAVSGLAPARVADLAASFQEAVVDCLVGKSFLCLRHTGLNTLCVGGGVAANRRLRERLEARAHEEGVRLHVAPPQLCTDNAAMAAIAVERFRAGEFADLDLDAYPGVIRRT